MSTVRGWQMDADYADWIASGCPGVNGQVQRIPSADVLVTITAPVTKLCPVKNETDEGTVTITYRTDGSAFELHALADFLRSFRERHLSHEDFTHEVAQLLGATVSSRWTTAGMEVACDAVLRQPHLITEGA